MFYILNPIYLYKKLANRIGLTGFLQFGFFFLKWLWFGLYTAEPNQTEPTHEQLYKKYFSFRAQSIFF